MVPNYQAVQALAIPVVITPKNACHFEKRAIFLLVVMPSFGEVVSFEVNAYLFFGMELVMHWVVMS